MNRRTAVVFAAVAIAVGVAVYFESRRKTADGPRDAAVEIFPFLGEEVVKLEIRRPAGTVVVEKREDLWWITQPRELLAHQLAVATILQNQVSPYATGTRLPAGQAPEPGVHGLDAPPLAVVLTGPDGRTARLTFGKPVGGVRRIFARAGDAPDILTVDEDIFTAFDLGAEKLRDRGLCRVGPEGLERLVTKRGEEQATLRRQGRAFRLEGPVDDFAGGREVSDWLSRFSAVETPGWERRQKASRAEYGLDPAWATIEVTARGRTTTLAVGAETEPGSGARWVEVSDFPDDIATVKTDAVENLILAPASLRTERVFPFPLETATGYAATGAGLDVEAVKSGDKWTLSRPGVPVPNLFSGRGDELLAEFSRLGISQRLPVADPPADAVTVTLSWGEGSGAVKHTARVWGDANVTRVLFDDPRRLVEVSDSSAWDHVRAGEMFFRNPLVIDNLLALQLQRVVLRDAAGVEADMLFNGREWTLAVPVPGRQLNPDRARDMSPLLAEMMADTWLRTEASDPATGLDKPAFRVQIEPNPAKVADARTVVVLVGARGPRGTRYAQVEGARGVFLLNAVAVTAIETGVWK